MVRALDDMPGGDAAEQRLKIPPYSVEAEQSLLGGLMLDRSAWDKVADIVVESDFYRKDHQLIFAAIGALADGGHPCDVVTVSEHLDNRSELEKAGGLQYLATLANETPGAANVAAYGKILRERSMLRSLITAGNTISGSAFTTEGRTAAEIVDEAERLVFEIPMCFRLRQIDSGQEMEGEEKRKRKSRKRRFLSIKAKVSTCEPVGPL